jgi:spoIIIJ-associated protein
VTNERRSQSITVSAKSVAEAIAEAERRLGLDQTEIDITVITEGSKGFLGMGGENARIVAMPKAILARRGASSVTTTPDQPAPDHVPSAPPAREEPMQAPVTATAEPAIVPAQREPTSAAIDHPQREQDDHEEAQHDDEMQPASLRVDPSEVAEVAVEVVRELLVRMGLDAQATVRSAGNPVIIDVMGGELGLLIGRHGETLGSFQYLVNAIVGKRVNRWCKVIVDVEHYRLRREDTLRSLATRQASRVRQTQQEIALDPMPAAERRVIHTVLQNNPWVTTNSVGEEPNRRVVIGPRQGTR